MTKPSGVEGRNDKVPDTDIQGKKAGQQARKDPPKTGTGASAGQPAAAPRKQTDGR